MTENTDIAELNEFNNRIAEGGEHLRPARTRDRAELASAPNGEFSFTNAKMWAMYGNTFSPCEKAVGALPPGQYTVEHSHERGIYFSKREINLDDIMVLPDSASEEVIKEITTFWTKEDDFRKLGFLWKRGVLLWGPQGSGKTTTVQLVAKNIIAQGGIAVYTTNPELVAKGLELLRRIEPTRPIVAMLEDIDAITDEHGESDLLALLDGELQIDNIVFVATTNYPERLDKRLINRPSRFDLIKKIGMPTEQARKIFIAAKNPRLAKASSVAELDVWVAKTKEFSLAHIKELIISVECFNKTFEEAYIRLKTMMGTKISSDEFNHAPIGFTGKP